MRRTRGVVSRKLILPIEPLMILENGTPIYPIMGSDPESQDGSEDEDPDGDGDDAEDEDDSEQDEDSDKKSKRRSKPKETPDQMRRRLNREAKEHREAREAAEAKLREIEDADKTELEIARRDLEELKAKYEKVPETLNNLRIENAFLKLPNYAWHDPEDVLEFVRKSPDVTIEDDGTVDGLESFVKNLAKRKPYLLKASEDEEEEQGSGSRRNGAAPRGPSGVGVGSGPRSRRNQDKAAQRAALASKYGLDNGR